MVEKTEAKLNPNRLAKVWTQFCGRLSSHVDQCATALIHPEKVQMGKKPHASLSKTRLSSPENEIKKLLTSTATLTDVWHFFLKRLKSGSPLDFMCFSFRDERNDFIRVRFLFDGSRPTEVAMPAVAQEPFISMTDHTNHLVQSYHRKDTTFSPRLSALGEEILALLPEAKARIEQGDTAFNLFSVPLIAGDQVIAMLTLGFREMDSFSQAKLSYLYTLRDQVAQLIWNLILQEQMRSQAQIDNLTGLLSYTYFQGVLERELAKADTYTTSTTVMLLDINNIDEINQTQGHRAGDEAICHLASTVRRLIRGVDTVARYGGDDVVVILPETEPQAAAEIADRFMAGMKIHLPAHLKHLSVSIGHATYPDDTKSKDKLLKLAEQALHLAKFKGSKTGESTHIGSDEVEQMNDKTVIEVFASQVAKKYNNIHVPSVYQELVTHIEKKADNKVKPDDLMLETVTSLAGALDAKDRYTRGHSQAVSNYAVALAHALKMSPTEVEEIRAAAFLHDIGKIGIPESILCKAGPLNEKEWDIMKQHPVIGAQQILYPVTSLRPIIPAVECHHENWDGTGHPYGYKGEKIPLGARIISIVDAFHALTSDRAYRKALPVPEARKILEAGSESKWDPHLMQVFFNILSIASPKTLADTPEESQLPAIFQSHPVQLKLETSLAGVDSL